jgi:hypothetical protein
MMLARIHADMAPEGDRQTDSIGPSMDRETQECSQRKGYAKTCLENKQRDRQADRHLGRQRDRR